jgi:hypothetical protein
VTRLVLKDRDASVLEEVLDERRAAEEGST